jgi:hypothetical protein
VRTPDRTDYGSYCSHSTVVHLPPRPAHPSKPKVAHATHRANFQRQTNIDLRKGIENTSDRTFFVCAHLADLRTTIFYRRICEAICAHDLSEKVRGRDSTFSKKTASHIDFK